MPRGGPITAGTYSDLPERTEETLRAAKPLLEWFRSATRPGSLKLFDLARTKDHHDQDFFDALELDGQPSMAMGCIQPIVYRRGKGVVRDDPKKPESPQPRLFRPGLNLVNGVDWLTLRRLGVRKAAHDALDRVFLQQHPLCHEKAIETVRPAFENINWVPAAGAIAETGKSATTNISAGAACD